MAALNDFIQPPTFYNGMFLSAHDINVLSKNAQYLDEMSYRRENFFDNMARKGGPSTAWHHFTGYLLWRGGHIFRVGQTTLTVKGRTQGSVAGTGRVRVFINGVMQSETTPPISDWTVNITITALGYTEGLPLVIEVYTYGLAADDRTSEWWISDVYVSPSYIKPPVTMITPWEQLPVFAGVYSHSWLNRLSNACVYLYDRMNQVPITPMRSFMWAPVTDKAEEYEIWTGSVTRFTSSDLMRFIWELIVFASTDTLKLYVDDVLHYTWPTLGVGTHTYSTPLAFPGSVAVGATVRLKLTTTVPTGRLNSQCSRFTWRVKRVDPQYPGYYPMQLPPTDSVAAASTPAYDVNNSLNRIVRMLNNVKARVESSLYFNRVRVYHDNYGYDAHARNSLSKINPARFIRRGSRLVVYGKNVTLGFGATTFEVDEDGNQKNYKYKFDNEQTLIEGEKADQKTIYLDSVPGLFVGDAYQLFGDVSFAAEYHR